MSPEFAVLFVIVCLLTAVNTVTGALGMVGFIQYNVNPPTTVSGTKPGIESFSRMMTPTCEGVFHCMEANSTNPLYIQFNVPPFSTPVIFSDEYITNDDVFTLLPDRVIIEKKGIYLFTILGSVFAPDGFDGEGALVLTQLPDPILQSPAIGGNVFHTMRFSLLGNNSVDIATVTSQVRLDKGTTVFLGYQVTERMALAPGSHMAGTLLRAL